MEKTKKVLNEILLERERQDKKWGEQDHPNGTGCAYYKILAKHHRSRCDLVFQEKRGTWEYIFLEEVYEALAEEDPIKLREELIQVAAVACSWVESIDRKLNEI